jgi:hypothetical protein
MPYYNTCPHCNANLDPGEKCDCPKAKALAPKPAKEISERKGRQRADEHDIRQRKSA